MTGIGRTTALAAGLFLLVAPHAHARPAAAPPCAGDGGELVQVAAVEDNEILRLQDGRRVRLVGADPVVDPGGAGLASQARTKLAAWLEGRAVRLVPLAAGVDRWNRFPALVFATTGADAAGEEGLLSVAQALVDAGMARARPEPAVHACWASLLAAEAAARTARLGIWDDPRHAVRHAENSAELAQDLGRMAIVEGRIARIAHGRSATYLVLGARSGLSLRILRRDRDVLASPLLTQGTAIGTNIRVRGYLDDRFGPTIDVTSMDQIEVLPQRDGDAPNAPGR